MVAYFETPSWYLTVKPIVLMYLLDSIAGGFLASLKPTLR
jgi:hypothetical protein